MEENKTAMDYLQNGRAFLDKGDYDNAIANFNQVIKLEPNNSMAYDERSNVYFKKGDDKATVGDDNAMDDYIKGIADIAQALCIDLNKLEV